MTAPCFVASSGVLPNSPAYNNGSGGVGATLTAGSNSTLVVQGITLSINQRVLVKDQASDFQNGIYYVSNAGSGSSPWVLTRATDFDTAAKMMAADLIPIITGADYTAVSTWLLDTTVNTIGTDSIDFEAYSVSPYIGGSSQGSLWVGSNINNNIATPAVVTGDVVISGAGVTTVEAISGANINLPGNPSATGTFSAAKFSGSSGAGVELQGTATNNNASAGDVGEYISSTVSSGSALSLTSGTGKAVTSISLTAGDWDVWGCAEFKGSTTASVSWLGAAINGTSGAVSDAPSGFVFTGFPTPGTLYNVLSPYTLTVPMTRISLAATTTVYLNAVSSFSSTSSVYGGIFARRVR